MNYEALVVGVALFVVVMVFMFILEEWARSKDGNLPREAPITKSTPVGNPDDKWTRLRLFMNQVGLNSEEAKEIIRQVKNEHPDGWFGKCFPDV